jgi:hypothetical protein
MGFTKYALVVKTAGEYCLTVPVFNYPKERFNYHKERFNYPNERFNYPKERLNQPKERFRTWEESRCSTFRYKCCTLGYEEKGPSDYSIVCMWVRSGLCHTVNSSV